MSTRGAFFTLCDYKPPRLGGSLAALVLTVAMALALAAPASAATAPQTSLADIEDEVMCPVCGTLLQLAEAPQAQRQRAFVERQIAAGRSKEEIKDALVGQYGQEVLALPEGSGFDLSAYLVPAVGLVLGVLGLVIGVFRWRRAGGGRSAAGRSPAGPRPEDAERLDADLARYDL